MLILRCIFAVAALLLGACASSGDSAPARDITIRLERGVCFGACPVYSVTLDETGAVAYRGERNVAVVGPQLSHVDPAQVAALTRRFEAAHFFDLRDAYRGRVTDLPSYRLTLTIDGRSKSVVDYAGEMDGMPAIVRTLEDEVDRVAGSARWVRPSETSAPKTGP